MEGGIICTCDDRTLDQLGITANNFDNFKCRSCGRFVHLHYSDEMEGKYRKVCAECSIKT